MKGIGIQTSQSQSIGRQESFDDNACISETTDNALGAEFFLS